MLARTGGGGDGGGSGAGEGGGGSGGTGGGCGGAATTGADTVAPVMLIASKFEVTPPDAFACADALAPSLALALLAKTTNTVALKATVGGAAVMVAPMDVPIDADAAPDLRIPTNPLAAAGDAKPITVKSTVDVVVDAAAATKRPVAQAAGGGEAPLNTTLEAGTPSAEPTAAARVDAFTQPPAAREMLSDDETARFRRQARVRRDDRLHCRQSTLHMTLHNRCCRCPRPRRRRSRRPP